MLPAGIMIAAEDAEGGRVSGIDLDIQASSTSATPTCIQKIARHPSPSTMRPPAMGDTIGATPMTAVMKDSATAACSGSCVSRTIARAATVPTLAPSACTSRAPMSQDRSGARAAAAPPVAKVEKPASITGRRPYRSHNSPCRGCASPSVRR